MKENSKAIPKFINSLLLDNRFFVFSIALFIAHTLWLALSAYSLPFDEYYHLGIIKFYSHQLSPFISHQPASVSYLGDITRLPSYLYEYLMSWPYRFFTLFTDNPYYLTVLMRSLNIAIVVVGLIIWRRLLLKLGISRRITHLTLFVFMLLPLVVLVAAESNYDNLMFMLTPIFFSMALDIVRGKTNIKNIVGFISLGLITSLVKHQFLVIFGLTLVLVGILVFKRQGLRNSYYKLAASVKTTSLPVVIGLLAILIFSSGLFLERYGYNFVRYHSINLDCAKVQPFDVCYQYSPWQRNFNTVRDKTDFQLYTNPAGFTIHWVTAMMRGFVANFANVLPIAKPWDPYGTYEFKPLLPLMIISGYTVLFATITSLIINFKKWWRVNWMRYSILLSGTYILILWLINYSSYLKTGQAYAIQPRYLYPLLILILACSAKLILMLIRNRNFASWLAGLVILIFVYCGGAIGWFLFANSSWYWPNQTNIRINQNIQRQLQKTIYHIDEN